MQGIELIGERQSRPIPLKESLKDRASFAGGFNLRTGYGKNSSLFGTMSTKTDSQIEKKADVFKMLGYKFSEDDQVSRTVSSRISEPVFEVTKYERNIDGCTLAQKFECVIEDHEPLSYGKHISVIPRSKKQQFHEKTVTFYYEPNGNRQGVVVINRSTHETQQPAHVSVPIVEQIVPMQTVQVSKEKGASKVKTTKSKGIDKPSPTEVLLYKQKYKDYIITKRDRHFASLLCKILDKIEFERFQCTSPNIERMKAEWNAKWRPRILMGTAGLLNLYEDIQCHGYEQLQMFLYLYICQKNYDLKRPYQETANHFIRQFSAFLDEKNKKKQDPTKALNKMAFRKRHEMLKAQVVRQQVCQFLKQMGFISLALHCYPFQYEQSKNTKLNYGEYRQLIEKSRQMSKTVEAVPVIVQLPERKTEKYSGPIFKTPQEIDRLQNICVPVQEAAVIDQNKKLSIRERRLLEDEQQRKCQQQLLMSYQFKAREVPKIVTDKNVFQKTKETEKKQTKLTIVQPFKFDQKEPPHIPTPEQYYKYNREFKARDVPNIVKQPIYDKMVEDSKIVRELNFRARHQKLMRSSSYPRTMSNLNHYHQERKDELEHQRIKMIGNIRSADGFYRDVPDFDRLHHTQMVRMEQSRVNFRPTTPQEFNLSKPRPKSATHNFGMTMPVRSSPEARLSKLYQSPKYPLTSTLKFDAIVAKRRQDQLKAQYDRYQKQHGWEPKAQQLQHKQQIAMRLLQGLPLKSPPRHRTLPKGNWPEKRNEIVQKVYEEQPLLIQRKYVREGGKKVQKIQELPCHTDHFEAII